VLDIVVERKLPVQVNWIGQLPENLRVVEVQVDPDTVLVKGAKLFLENVSTLYTEKVPADNLKDEGIITANLCLNPASLKIAAGSKDTVSIAYKTGKRESGLAPLSHSYK
jgi:YbbR domain-containing protein